MPTGEKERFMVGNCRKFFQSFVVNENSLPEWLTVFLLSVSFFRENRIVYLLPGCFLADKSFWQLEKSCPITGIA
jgi:hypothetical protein